MAEANTVLKYRLATNAKFQARVEACMWKYADWIRTHIDVGGVDRPAFLALADKVQKGEAAIWAARMALMLPSSTNVIAADIVQDDWGEVSCTITDTNLQSQIESLWLALAKDGTLV